MQKRILIKWTHNSPKVDDTYVCMVLHFNKNQTEKNHSIGLEKGIINRANLWAQDLLCEINFSSIKTDT